MTNRVRPIAALAVCGSLAAFALAARAAPVVTVIDIGGFGGPRGPSAALGVNGGLAVGYAVTAGRNGQANAVASRGAALGDIGAGLYGTLATAVNASGLAVGEVYLPGQTQARAVEFAGGREINLGVLPGDATSIANAVNGTGTVVGTSTHASRTPYVSQAFVYANGTMVGVPALRALTSFLGATATGINDAGSIVGSVGQKAAFGAATSSYVLSGSTLTLFATNRGGGNSVATAINASGVVAGYHSTFSFSVNAPLHAYTYSGGTLTDLGTLYPNDGFAESAAFAINAAGVAVGYSQQKHPLIAPHATAFAGGTITDLNALLPANSGWLLEEAEGIDDLGNIVGIGLHAGAQRGFILRTGSLYAARKTLH